MPDNAQVTQLGAQVEWSPDAEVTLDLQAEYHVILPIVELQAAYYTSSVQLVGFGIELVSDTSTGPGGDPPRTVLLGAEYQSKTVVPGPQLVAFGIEVVSDTPTGAGGDPPQAVLQGAEYQTKIVVPGSELVSFGIEVVSDTPTGAGGDPPQTIIQKAEYQPKVVVPGPELFSFGIELVSGTPNSAGTDPPETVLLSGEYAAKVVVPGPEFFSFGIELVSGTPNSAGTEPPNTIQVGAEYYLCPTCIDLQAGYETIPQGTITKDWVAEYQALTTGHNKETSTTYEILKAGAGFMFMESEYRAANPHSVEKSASYIVAVPTPKDIDAEFGVHLPYSLKPAKFSVQAPWTKEVSSTYGIHLKRIDLDSTYRKFFGPSTATYSGEYTVWVPVPSIQGGSIYFVKETVPADTVGTVGNLGDPFGIQKAFDLAGANDEIRIVIGAGNYGSTTSSWNNRYNSSKKVYGNNNFSGNQPLLIRGVAIDGTTETMVTLDFTGGTSYGIEMGLLRMGIFKNLQVTGAASHGWSGGNTGHIFYSCNADNNGSYGFNLGTSFWGIGGGTAIGCVSNNNNSKGITSGKAYGIEAYSNGSSGIEASYPQFCISDGNTQTGITSLIATHCTTHNNGANGIVSTQNYNCIATNNALSGFPWPSNWHHAVFDCIAYGNTSENFYNATRYFENRIESDPEYRDAGARDYTPRACEAMGKGSKFPSGDANYSSTPGSVQTR